MHNEERVRVLQQQVVEVEAALMTSFGDETIMLMRQLSGLREQLGGSDNARDVYEDYETDAA